MSSSVSFRVGLAGLLVVLGLGLGGCGRDESKVSPEDFDGTYEVMIEANGRSDRTRMFALPGSDGALLLNFTFGISELRCQLAEQGRLTLATQPVRVQHSTGTMDGVASGEGTISAEGAVDLTLQVEVAGTDGGMPTDGGSGGLSLRITGNRL
jgi:hypothetical protein